MDFLTIVTTVVVLVLTGYTGYLFASNKDGVRIKSMRKHLIPMVSDDGLFHPPAKYHANMQANGAIIGFLTHFEPVDRDDWPSDCKLIPTYTEVFICDGGHRTLIDKFPGSYWDSSAAANLTENGKKKV